ncbi:Hypothetical predicted protein, partial [Paramuricea clavata]
MIKKRARLSRGKENVEEDFAIEIIFIDQEDSVSLIDEGDSGSLIVDEEDSVSLIEEGDS